VNGASDRGRDPLLLPAVDAAFATVYGRDRVVNEGAWASFFFFSAFGPPQHGCFLWLTLSPGTAVFPRSNGFLFPTTSVGTPEQFFIDSR